MQKAASMASSTCDILNCANVLDFFLLQYIFKVIKFHIVCSTSLKVDNQGSLLLETPGFD